MDVKSILKMALNPYVLAAAGTFAGYRWHKKAGIKNRYVGSGAGLLAGYVAGSMAQRMLGPAQAPQLPAEQQQAQGDFVELDLGETPFGVGTAYGPRQLPAPQFDSSPANVQAGEGSYGATSYNVRDTEAAMGEAEEILAEKRRNGSN